MGPGFGKQIGDGLAGLIMVLGGAAVLGFLAALVFLILWLTS